MVTRRQLFVVLKHTLTTSLKKAVDSLSDNNHQYLHTNTVPAKRVAETGSPTLEERAASAASE